MDLDEALRVSEARYPDLHRAATEGEVTFQHVLQARAVRKRADRLDRELGRALERVIRHRFEERHGRILMDYWGTVVFGGCLLTDSGVVHLAMNVDVADVVVLQTRLEQLCRDAQAVFADERLTRQRTEAGQSLFSVASRLVATADVLQDGAGTAAPDPRAAQRVAAMNREWALTRGRIEVLIQRQARFEYFVGVLAGAVVALVVVGVIGWLAAAHWQDQIAVPAFLAATIAGTAGGVISVTQRMAAGRLVLDYTASVRQKLLLGAARPVVAATLAAMIQFGLLGGLLTMQNSQSTEATPATFAFFALVGFAAGFSERLATDMIENAGQVLFARGGEPPPAASASGAPETDAPLTPPPAA